MFNGDAPTFVLPSVYTIFGAIPQTKQITEFTSVGLIILVIIPK